MVLAEKKFPALSVLLVDDDESVRFTLKIALKAVCNVFEADSPDSCMELLKEKDIDLILLDVGLRNSRGEDTSGIDLIPRIKELSSGTEIIMVTAMHDTETALIALRKGAYDYLTKPFNVEELRLLVIRVLDKRTIIAENDYLRHELASTSVHHKVVVKDKNTIALYKQAETVARSISPVLIYGENGCGKEVLARFIHEKSDRADGPFIAINCGGIPENLLESELFGYEKGAFTGAAASKRGKFEIANGGTVFLDEIGNMSMVMQVKLLRVIQEMQIERLGGTTLIPLDVRFVSATNVDLDKAIKLGNFREDLFFRLKVVSFNLAPLRERLDDINYLIDYFIEFFSARNSMSQIVISPIVRKCLQKFGWPGNVRQLKNLIESFYALYGSGAEISFSCLPVEMLMAVDCAKETSSEDVQAISLKDAVDEFEKDYLTRVLRKCEGNQSQASKVLQVHRNTLSQKISQFNITF